MDIKCLISMFRFVHCISFRRPNTSGIDEVDECNNFAYESFGNHQLSDKSVHKLKSIWNFLVSGYTVLSLMKFKSNLYISLTKINNSPKVSFEKMGKGTLSP